MLKKPYDREDVKDINKSFDETIMHVIPNLVNPCPNLMNLSRVSNPPKKRF